MVSFTFYQVLLAPLLMTPANSQLNIEVGSLKYAWFPRDLICDRFGHWLFAEFDQSSGSDCVR
ncbi:uncharacterized protein PHALS_13183 [Plasmopara halstedii]|uniref:RxLR-like protein n=1 Tax=Plasmopara halstedii TaxID=4781 RepID=A0A0P1ANE8_PLAHL|nr:uncharacterized protein PHALS_13183 [Plasmopara halstedii]CEG42950.1 hypothetical protein PHALS_13183 [Plasmopara halstedii]|eukprot:XP_024579319.1 hypothetical protein PHALS_13183 [Plasmopara halstedii]